MMHSAASPRHRNREDIHPAPKLALQSNVDQFTLHDDERTNEPVLNVDELTNSYNSIEVGTVRKLGSDCLLSQCRT